MKNALIIHGCVREEEYYSPKYPSSSNFHWIPWLQKQLLIHDIPTQTPEMPNPRPVYAEWRTLAERFDVNDETILIGHSCGGGFLLRWLGEAGVRVKKLVLVAPYLDPNKKRGDFLEFALNPKIRDYVEEIHVLISCDEEESIKTSVETIMDVLPEVTLHEFTGMGHFTLDQMRTEAFPELLNIVLGEEKRAGISDPQ